MDGFKMCLYFSALMAVANADATDSISSKFNLNINEIFILHTGVAFFQMKLFVVFSRIISSWWI